MTRTELTPQSQSGPGERYTRRGSTPGTLPTGNSLVCPLIKRECDQIYKFNCGEASQQEASMFGIVLLVGQVCPHAWERIVKAATARGLKPEEYRIGGKGQSAHGTDKRVNQNFVSVTRGEVTEHDLPSTPDHWM